MTLAGGVSGRLTDPCARGRHGAGLRSGELAGKPVPERTRQRIPRANHRYLLRCLLRCNILSRFEVYGSLRQHQLSLIHPQLKVGTANQRHPYSPAATLLSRNSKQK